MRGGGGAFWMKHYYPLGWSTTGIACVGRRIREPARIIATRETNQFEMWFEYLVQPEPLLISITQRFETDCTTL